MPFSFPFTFTKFGIFRNFMAAVQLEFCGNVVRCCLQKLKHAILEEATLCRMKPAEHHDPLLLCRASHCADG
jgi:hypothetical protein